MMSEPRCSRVCRCVYMRVQVCLCVQCVKSVCVCKCVCVGGKRHVIVGKRIRQEATTKHLGTPYVGQNYEHAFVLQKPYQNTNFQNVSKCTRSTLAKCVTVVKNTILFSKRSELFHMQNLQFCRDVRWLCWRLVRGHEQHVLWP